MAAPRLTLLAFAVLASVAMAGCSGGDDTGGEGSPSPTATASASVPASVSATASPTASSSPSASASPTPRPSQTFDVVIEGNDFVDGTLTVQKGDTVRWTQRDVAQHTVTADGGAFDSGTLTLVSPAFSHTFDTLGDFPYHCEVHASMTDTITVVAVLS